MENENKVKHHCRGNFWAWTFVIVGSYFLAEQYGLLPKDAPFPWPLLFIIVGIYWLFKKRRFSCSCE